jgi:hypothetical protein
MITARRGEMQPSGYSRRTLAEKLGLKPGMSACLLDTPLGYLEALGPVVAHLHLIASPDGAANLDFLHAFFTERAALIAHLPSLKAALAPAGMLWISWPKKAAKLPTDLDEHVIHDLGLATGLVDVKVAAIDPVWSAFKFVYRLKDR